MKDHQGARTSVTGNSTCISLKTQRDTTIWEGPKSKEKISNQLNKNTSYSLLEKNKQQFSDIAKFVIVKKQTLVSAGKCLGRKPPQLELQQQCELANVSLIKETQLCIYWEGVNTTGLFMSIERRTLNYSNLSARTGTIAAKTVHS